MKALRCILIVLLVCLLFTGCGNTLAKRFGGTINVEVPNDKKLVNITWKDEGNLWVLTRDRKADEVAETYTFQEYSNFGIVEGKVIIKEK